MSTGTVSDYQHGRHDERQRTIRLILAMRKSWGEEANHCLDRLVMDIVSEPLSPLPQLYNYHSSYQQSKELP